MFVYFLFTSNRIPSCSCLNHEYRWQTICYQVICYHLAIKAKHSFLVKRCLIATLELNAIHCVIYMVRRYIVLYGGKSMEGNMCNNLDNGHSACVWFLVSCLVVELCSLKFVALYTRWVECMHGDGIWSMCKWMETKN